MNTNPVSGATQTTGINRDAKPQKEAATREASPDFASFYGKQKTGWQLGQSRDASRSARTTPLAGSARTAALADASGVSSASSVNVYSIETAACEIQAGDTEPVSIASEPQASEGGKLQRGGSDLGKKLRKLAWNVMGESAGQKVSDTRDELVERGKKAPHELKWELNDLRGRTHRQFAKLHPKRTITPAVEKAGETLGEISQSIQEWRDGRRQQARNEYNHLLIPVQLRHLVPLEQTGDFLKAADARAFNHGAQQRAWAKELNTVSAGYNAKLFVLGTMHANASLRSGVRLESAVCASLLKKTDLAVLKKCPSAKFSAARDFIKKVDVSKLTPDQRLQLEDIESFLAGAEDAWKNRSKTPTQLPPLDLAAPQEKARTKEADTRRRPEQNARSSQKTRSPRSANEMFGPVGSSFSSASGTQATGAQPSRQTSESAKVQENEKDSPR